MSTSTLERSGQETFDVILCDIRLMNRMGKNVNDGKVFSFSFGWTMDMRYLDDSLRRLFFSLVRETVDLETLTLAPKETSARNNHRLVLLLSVLKLG